MKTLPLFPSLLFLFFHVEAQSLPAVGASTIAGTINGITISATVQGPAEEKTPLQIACVFEYEEGDIYNPPALPAAVNGMQQLDKALHGLITDLRKSGKFSGHAFETLLITPAAGTIPAERLLLIGLGNRQHFTPDIMTLVGSVGMREALRLGVDRYAHASDLKDAGIDSPTAEVAANILKGAIAAYRTQLYLQNRQMAVFKPLTGFVLLAGPAFYETTAAALKETVATLQ
ncbi:M17 family peptidase N-terminal domain-containing protein [Chitinophaga sp. 30R24]|uniref:M17 family peptidase N-terminal domain-containing protein n=1 Tax=Chitinophaga sp. 30R24 TaxID=3248838 RepID=UPI003B9076A5